jgi:hypothetical protein
MKWPNPIAQDPTMTQIQRKTIDELMDHAAMLPRP